MIGGGAVPTSAHRNGTATPAPTTGTTTNGVQLTPNRAARLEEKSELQELNKRLELYILKMREREDSSSRGGGVMGMIDDVRARAEKEMAAVRALSAEQVNDIRSQRDAAMLKAAELEHKLKQYVICDTTQWEMWV